MLVSKPCKILKYCPYGPLVEQFPLRPGPMHHQVRREEDMACRIFGHQCPVFYTAEEYEEERAEEDADLEDALDAMIARGEVEEYMDEDGDIRVKLEESP